MKLIVLGSSSKGNGYLFRSDKTGAVLAVEAGCSLSATERALRGNISDVVACIVSHEHGDHAAHVREYLGAYIPVVMSPDTAADLGVDVRRAPSLHVVREYDTVRYGAFTVTPFSVPHTGTDDAPCPCYAYLIHHPECGNVLFATDCSYISPTFNAPEHRLSNVLIEANYSRALIERNLADGSVNYRHYEHTVLGHMSYETCRETLLANDLSLVNNIVLIHLSDVNSDEAAFVRGITARTHKHVIAARPGLAIDFNQTPY